ncbi:tetratricopeptide repeat protein [Salinispira pacifica]
MNAGKKVVVCRLALTVSLVLLVGITGAFAQQSGGGTGGQGQTAAADRSSAPGGTVEPVFPVENSNLIFVEGENAVVTNFDKEPILNYSASGLQTLQLSKTEDPAAIGGGDAAYYADFVFYVDQSGEYEFWYGGTPPGPATHESASYTSPISFKLDDNDPVTVNREDVKVAGSYAPSYYWVRVGKVQLDAGPHRLSFRVDQKRQYDGRYLFYLDNFFLVRTTGGTPDPGSPLPSLFPSSLTDFSQDRPFRAVEDYLIDIRDHPDNVESYIDLSLVYSLVGDYLNALKYLNRAAVRWPDNRTVALLRAKNLIWKGDLGAGLDAYSEILKNDPKQLDLWAEAGKVAAWTGRYQASIQFFNDGLKQFPDNVNLTINEGLTYLWSGDEKRAQELFDRARRTAQKDYGKLLDLARTLAIAKAVPKAVEAYQNAIQLFPRNLSAYLDLEKLYVDNGQEEQAKQVQAQIAKTFAPSARLTRFLELARQKENLKSEVIAGYEHRLETEPDNLALREVLAETYFWNGMQEKGTNEYLNILVNYSYRALSGLDGEAPDLVKLVDRSHLLGALFTAAPNLANRLRATLEQRWAAAGTGAPAATAAQQAAARAAAFVDEITRLQTVAAQDATAAEKVLATEKEAADSFRKVTESNHWRWQREDMLAEMQTALANGVELASYGIGKIYQLDSRLASAQTVFRSGIGARKPAGTSGTAAASNPAASGSVDAMLQYELSQTLLWEGNLNAALTEAGKLPADDSRFAAATEWSSMYRAVRQAVPDLAAAASGTSTDSGSGAGSEGGGSSSAQFRTLDQARVQELISELQKAAASAAAEATKITRLSQTLHDALWSRMIRTLYRNQEATFQLRNDLGGYYLAQKKLDDAIRQFNQVLAIDPWDIPAVYRLGQVYEWKGAWSAALANYEKVYYSDPTYENVAHRYNELARKHPDSLNISGKTTADTSIVRYEGNVDYNTLFNSVLGLHLQADAAAQRLYKPPTGESVSDYQLYTITVGLPLDLYFWGVKLEPQVGAALANRLFENSTVSSPSFPAYPGADRYFGNFTVSPVLQLDASVGIGQYLYLSGTYRYDRQPETFVPGRPAIYEHTGELNLTTSLGFIGGYPFDISSLRTYGEASFLSDGNLMTTAVQDINIGLLSLEKPSTQLSLLGSVQFQNSARQESVNYYTPLGVLLAGGGFQGSIWLPAGEDAVGISLRTLASYYLEKIFTPADMIKRLQLDGEARFEYDRGGAALYLSLQASTTYRLDPPPPNPGQGPWDYWAFTVSLGYGAQLPKLLVP